MTYQIKMSCLTLAVKCKAELNSAYAPQGWRRPPSLSLERSTRSRTSLSLISRRCSTGRTPPAGSAAAGAPPGTPPKALCAGVSTQSLENDKLSAGTPETSNICLPPSPSPSPLQHIWSQNSFSRDNKRNSLYLSSSRGRDRTRGPERICNSPQSIFSCFIVVPNQTTIGIWIADPISGNAILVAAFSTGIAVTG